jgi:hypothetical protein
MLLTMVDAAAKPEVAAALDVTATAITERSPEPAEPNDPSVVVQIPPRR